MAGMIAGSFATVLEADLRQLSSDARRSEGIVGWLSGPEYPEIKEAAERALLKLRQSASDTSQMREHKEILKPFLLACEVKSTKLISISLVSIQRMLANEAVSSDGVAAIVAAMEQVENSHDEGVQLKLLQTALTLFQSPFGDITEEQIRRVLSVCFRLLSNPRNSDSVLNTAAATVRQVVALVFDHVLDKPDTLLLSSSNLPGSSRSSFASQVSFTTDAASAERSTAALKLLDDLCHLAVGQEAQWMKTPAIPCIFVLDVLDFILANSAAVFKTIPEFEHALLVRICQLLINQLQELLNKTKPEAADNNELRVVLRVVRTVVRNFYRQLKQKCGVFIETLLNGMGPQRSLHQRVLILQVFKNWCSETDKLQFLFETYDMRSDCKLKAVERMTAAFADTIDTSLKLAGEVMDEDPIVLLANLYYSRQTGKAWTLDMDFASSSSDVGFAYLTMLALDCLLNIVTAMEKLVDRAVPFPGEAPVTPSSVQGPVDAVVCKTMLSSTWKVLHQSLSMLLGRCAGEALTLQLLRGYQAMTQSAGVLELNDARDAFLASLCEFALMQQVQGTQQVIEVIDAAAVASELTAQSQASPPPRGSLSGGPTSTSAVANGSPSPGTGPLSTRNATGEPNDGLVLTPKNVQALRTLFNIAHRLHASLGPSWNLVLETLNALDRILNSPRTTTQELSSDVVAGSRPSDLNILATAATQLFESTADFNDRAVLSLLVALREVSAHSLTYGMLQPPSAFRLYAANRMVEVLQCNRHRLPDLWKVFSSHIVEVVSNSSLRPVVRQCAMDALGRAIGGLLPAPQPEQHGGPATGDLLRAASCVNRESMLLAVLEQALRDASEQDAALAVLRVSMSVLQHHGEQLSDGWSAMLSLLQRASSSPDESVIRLAFQNVQLVCSDYLWVMPYPDMLRTLQVAAMFGAQQRDLNVSLTTISLLWNAADAMGKACVAEGPKAEVPVEVPPTLLDNGTGVGRIVTLQEYLETLDVVLTALQGLCTDQRPEVRNSGMRTLFSVVNSVGARLTAASWEDVLWGRLHPLVRTVHHQAATSSREEAEGAMLGKGVKMLVHHSRNSEQKQWDETLVLALNGMAKLFKAYLPQISSVPGLVVGWQELMLVVESSIAGGRKETAMAAISMVSNVLMTHANSPVMDVDMWKRSLRAIDVGIEAATSPSCMIPLQARLELVNTISHLYSQHRRRFDADDLRQFLSWVEKFGRNPCSFEDVSAVLPGTLPAVQRAVLALLPNLAPVPLPEMWHDVFSCLLRLLRPHVLESASAGCGNGSEVGAASPAIDSKTGSAAMQRLAYSSVAMEKVVEVLQDLFTEHLPWQVKASEFGRVAAALGRCMATRFTVYSANLWRTASSAFCSIVTAGLPAVNVAFAEQPPHFEAAWKAAVEAFEWYIVGAMLQPQQLSPSAAAHNASPDGEGPLGPAGPSIAQQSRLSIWKRSFSFGVSAKDNAGANTAKDLTTAVQAELQIDRANSAAAGTGLQAVVGTATGSSAQAPQGSGPSAVEFLSEADTARLRADSEIEASVLDALTDVALTACAQTDKNMRLRLIKVLDEGIVRPRHLNLPEGVTGTPFSHLCLRKMYVLCSRGAQSQVPCLLQVAQLALPVLLARCDAMLRAYVKQQRLQSLQATGVGVANQQSADVSSVGGSEGDTGGQEPFALDEVMCVLEVMATMTLTPPVVDAALVHYPNVQALVAVNRQRRELAGAKSRERTHLLLLYGALCECASLQESRIRDMIRDVLQMAGVEMGLPMGLEPYL